MPCFIAARDGMASRTIKGRERWRLFDGSCAVEKLQVNDRLGWNVGTGLAVPDPGHLWERACPRKRSVWGGDVGWDGVFAGKPAPTRIVARWGFCGHAPFNCGSGLARESGLSGAVMLAGTASSRASPLPQGFLARRRFGGHAPLNCGSGCGQGVAVSRRMGWPAAQARRSSIIRE